eukprot:10412088-Lingulodinium_polyedra.AAC.1
MRWPSSTSELTRAPAATAATASAAAGGRRVAGRRLWTILRFASLAADARAALRGARAPGPQEMRCVDV